MTHQSLRIQSFVAICLAVAAVIAAATAAAADDRVVHDLVLRNGIIYDGSGREASRGDVVIDADRITYVGPHYDVHARTEIDVKGEAIAPGFINMLAHPEESLFADGRALSDLKQGVTLEVMGEFSMGPLNAKMKELMVKYQEQLRDEGLKRLGALGIPHERAAKFVGSVIE